LSAADHLRQKPVLRGSVVAVALDAKHRFSKTPRLSVILTAGYGVEGDAHYGQFVRHRYLARRKPRAPNLRQVHLVHAELHDELAEAGFPVEPGQMGENITTRGVDLLALPTGARLHLGDTAVVEVTGLRNPCLQLEGIHSGLMQAVLDRDADGNLIRKAGVMGVVANTGTVRPGDDIRVELPAGPHTPLVPV